MRPALVLLALLLAGCASPGPSPAPPTATAPGGPLVDDLADCRAWNVFLQTTEERVRPFVPANWSFTQAASGHAIVRIFVVSCAEGDFLALLSTPMVPDAASLDKHENPDVIVDAFAPDAATAARWTAVGARGAVAQLTRIGDSEDAFTLSVTTAEGEAVRLEALPATPTPAGTYEWRAVYAAGTETIGWAWGDEASNDTVTRPFVVALGPGTRLAEADATPQALAQEWRDVDLRYLAGVPPA